jgi:hypothetical protein
MTELDDLYAELEAFAQPERTASRPAREERILAGFGEIQRFVETHGRPPQEGPDRPLFERLYAVRLERIRTLEECRALLAPLDHQGLLEGAPEPAPELSDDQLLTELDDFAVPPDMTELRHVRPRAEIQAAEDVAGREACLDFETFRPLFDGIQNDLKSGARRTVRFGQNAAIAVGDTFILGGQMVYIARMEEKFRTPNGEQDARLRAIYSNGTESNILIRSLQRALYKDETGRRITDPDFGPLFGESMAEGDEESGTIYVLRSLSSHPFVSEHREIIHKIGVTSGPIAARIANAAHESTYLLADVEVVASYKLVGINRTRLENILHRIFAPAQLDLTIQDRFGTPVKPREWFLVPIQAIDEAVERIRDGSIAGFVYDPGTACLVPAYGR